MRRAHGTFRFRRSNHLPVVIAMLLCSASLFGQNGSFTSFDAPGAGTGPQQGTYPADINLNGAIAGYYADDAGIRHGFIRQPSGQFIEFSPPDISGVIVVGINNRGQVLGWGTTRKQTVPNVGFLRDADGSYHVFAPADSTDLVAKELNNQGEATGYYEDAANIYHGFLRDARGGLLTIDDPEAVLSAGNGTFATAINDKGEIAGYYNDKNTGGVRAFVRDEFGNFTNFDAVAGGSSGIVPTKIDLSGEVAGQYFGSDFRAQGFLRDATGDVADFDIADANSVVVSGMNDSGTIVGFWQNSQLYWLGYERNTAGGIDILSQPNLSFETQPASINNRGSITGSWEDLQLISHGFVR